MCHHWSKIPSQSLQGVSIPFGLFGSINENACELAIEYEYIYEYAILALPTPTYTAKQVKNIKNVHEPLAERCSMEATTACPASDYVSHNKTESSWFGIVLCL